MDPLFELIDVAYSYGRHPALRDVSLTVRCGAIGLVGQNGAGKSTLIHLLLGLIRPTAGSLKVFASERRGWPTGFRQRVGFMPERESLLPGLKGIEYVALAGQLCGMPRRDALRRAHETLSYLELEEARYRAVEQYSVGMRQRLKLAAALVHDPDLLLLDEPTSGLDPDGRAAMLDVLAVLAARPGKSLVLSTHLLGDVERICEEAIVLDAGRVVGVGPIREMRTVSAGTYRVRWRGDGNRLADRLLALGAEVRDSERSGEAQVVVPEGWQHRDFFKAAREGQVVLTGLKREEEDLEAVYQRLIGAGTISRGDNHD
ncbi:MAG: ABC transporter ATP-binding protein [Pirellulales bacterium]|nr:ABC transporter ATP-binding protein [Pirellulales bacterium]